MTRDTPFTEIHFTVEFEVPASFHDRFVELAARLADATRSDEPDTLAYQWFWNSDRSRVIVRELFRDSAAVLAHFESPTFRACLPEMLEGGKVVRFEVCGDAGPDILDGLADLGVVHYTPWQGFCRVGDRS